MDIPALQQKKVRLEVGVETATNRLSDISKELEQHGITESTDINKFFKEKEDEIARLETETQTLYESVNARLDAGLEKLASAG